MNYSNTGRPEEFSIRVWHDIYAIRFKLSELYLRADVEIRFIY